MRWPPSTLHLVKMVVAALWERIHLTIKGYVVCGHRHNFCSTPSNFTQQKSFGVTHDTIFQPTCRIRLFLTNLSPRVSQAL